MITRLSRRSDFQAVTERVSHALDEALHPLVVGAERVLAQHGALGLVVELQMDPIDGEVATTLLRALDEVATQSGAGGLRWDRLRTEDREVVGDPRDRTTVLEEVVQPALAVDVVVREVELRDARVPQRQVVLGAVALDQLPLDHPVDLTLDEREILRLDRLEAALPQVERPLDHWCVQ